MASQRNTGSLVGGSILILFGLLALLAFVVTAVTFGFVAYSIF